MADVEFKLNYPGLRELLKSAGVLGDLMARGRRVAASAGPGHVVVGEIGANRARVAVVTASREAAKAEAESRNLLRALDAAR